MNEKMQMLFAHIACVTLIVACFWLSTTVLKDQPQLGQVVIGAGLFLWGKIGFRPSDPVVETILESLTPKQVRKVVTASHRPPPLAAVPVMVAPVCIRCATLLSPTSNGPLCDACLISPPPRSAA
jgi:hypothetical protein